MGVRNFVNKDVCRQFRDAKDPILCFVHAQRTGGSALRAYALEKAYGVDKVYAPRNVEPYKHWPYLTDGDLAGFRAYAGHSYFQEIKINRPFFFIGLVRDPVMRAASLYYYSQRKEGHFLRDLANSTSMEKFHIEGAKINPAYFVNVQCRILCGHPAQARRALEGIKKRFTGIGFTEKLAEFVGEIGAELGWAGTTMDKRDSDARYQGKIDESFREMILERDREDLALFNALLNGLER